MVSDMLDDILARQLASDPAFADIEAVRRVARTAVSAAGEVIVRMRADGDLGERLKNPRDVVTAADLESERIVLDIIRAHFPEDSIISEESSAQTTSIAGEPALLESRSWVLDPIDGTVNYAHGSPLVGISLGFGFGGIMQYGIVAMPFLGLTYEAVRSKGAYRNGQQIVTSNRTTLTESLIATGFPYERSNLEPLLERVRTILIHCQDLRRCGAASVDLCFVAEGTFEGYLEDVQPWDMAAGLLIAQEAGAKVGWYHDGGAALPEALRGGGLLVAAPGVFNPLMRLFKPQS
jgi:myo-inositol-1(or 4)-monophosphatase